MANKKKSSSTNKTRNKSTTKKTTNNAVKKEIKEEPKKEESKLIKEMNQPITKELIERNKRIDEELCKALSDKNDTKVKKKSHFFTNTFIVITMLTSMVWFFINITSKNITVESIINCSIIALFSIIYLMICLTYNKKNKGLIFISSLLLFSYFIFNINNYYGFVNLSTSSVIDLRDKSLTEAVKWASKNDIKIIQDYEYSDTVPEYNIISQDVKVGTDINDIESITVSVSEGANPSKEIVVPSMLTWDSERVINYIKNNHLNNVIVDFVESDKLKDTVIDQNISGNLKRDDELKLTFSYGDEGNSDVVKLIDLKNKTKFEIEFYMKQHHLNYDFDYDFSSKIKKDYGLKQSIAPNEDININDAFITVTLSKGPKIVVPDLNSKSITYITNWGIKNRLKLEFIDKYDDNIKEGKVIDCDKKKGDVIEQKSLVKITVSLGKLKMPKFKNIDSFYNWADKYEIKYEVRYEFSNSVPAGEVISYSVKKGQTIKNDEAIIVTLSNGKSCKVPNLKGLTKSEAISKLKKENLEYNFVYKNSDKTKDKVLSQSISADSEISCGITITVTLSNGKGEDSSSINKRENNNNNSSNNNTTPSSNNNNNHNNNNNNNNNNNSNNNNTPTPTPTCNSCNIRSSQIFSVIEQYNSCSAAASALRSSLQSKCPGLTVNVSCQNRDGYDSADFVSGFDGGPITSCDSISIVLAN